MSMTTESRLRRHHNPASASTIHRVGLIIFIEMRDRRQRGQGRYLHWHSDESCLVWVVKLSQHTLLIDSLHSLSVCFLSHIQNIYNTYFGLQLAVDILYWHVTSREGCLPHPHYHDVRYEVSARPRTSIILFGVWLKNYNFPPRQSSGGKRRIKFTKHESRRRCRMGAWGAGAWTAL